MATVTGSVGVYNSYTVCAELGWSTPQYHDIVGFKETGVAISLATTYSRSHLVHYTR
jgi:hypothetical protein